MERSQILDAVYDACVEILKVDKTDLRETTSFADDLDADSLALVEIVMQLEEHFDLRIPEDDLDGVTTIGAAADVVADHLAAAA
ncbi:acyl carrier protein [Aquihabitans daechungensis]|uniref:acyl carrier protein n=1 Tax=Aquihabitans daechungensis TaxID=1052257 RepID=UPI003BA27D9F